MTMLQINLSNDAKARLEAQAAEEGFATVEQYAEALLLTRAGALPTDQTLENLLSARAEDARPGIELTPQFVEQFRDQVRQRRASAEARQ